MDSAYATSTYNVKATLRAWCAGAIAAYPPALATGATFTVEMPQEPIGTPVFTAQFADQIDEANYTGGIVGAGQYGALQLGMMHVVMYASRRAVDWRAELAQMTDAIRKAYRSQAARVVIIKDFATDPVAPADTVYKLVLSNIEQSSFTVSRNPDIEGAALHITYRYVERV